MHNPLQAQVVALSAAIAHAEGFWVPDALPRQHNNPGDLVGDGSVNHIFNTRLDGFDALAAKLTRILQGGSVEYPTSLRWTDFAERWTGGDHAGSWCDSVTDDLNLDPSTRLVDWLLSVPVPAPAPAPDQTTPAS